MFLTQRKKANWAFIGIAEVSKEKVWKVLFSDVFFDALSVDEICKFTNDSAMPIKPVKWSETNTISTFKAHCKNF